MGLRILPYQPPDSHAGKAAGSAGARGRDTGADERHHDPPPQRAAVRIPLRARLYGVAAAVPRVRVAEPTLNADHTLALARRASEDHAALVVFPELGLSAYSNDDLFHQAALLDAVTDGLRHVRRRERRRLAGDRRRRAPAADQRLFNAAVVIHRGAVLGAVPKSYLPNYREYYEKRQFSAARDAISDTARVLGRRCRSAPTSCSNAVDLPSLVLGVEVCEDLWAPLPPSTFAALAGATVLANLSASNITIGKADYRRSLCASQSARMIAAYLYTAADSGESTTDLAWDGQALICENGDLLAESERFAGGDALTIADVDLDRLVADRARTTSFADCAHDHRERLRRMRRIGFELGVPGDSWCRSGATWSASPTCPRIRSGATSAARRSTGSRCRGSRRAFARRASRRP